MKNFIMGVLITLVIELAVFAYNTVSTTVTTTVSYNPNKVIELLGTNTTINN